MALTEHPKAWKDNFSCSHCKPCNQEEFETVVGLLSAEFTDIQKMYGLCSETLTRAALVTLFYGVLSGSGAQEDPDFFKKFLAELPGIQKFAEDSYKYHKAKRN